MSDFFTTAAAEDRTFQTVTGFMTIEVRVVTAAEDHVGDPFLLRKSGKLFRACGRCGGYGHFSYNRIDGTLCFDCRGRGLGAETTWEEAERLVKARRATRNRRDKAERDAAHALALEWNAFYADHADVISWLDGKEERSGFVGDMARKVANLHALSEKMVAAARRIIGQDAEKQETRAAAGHFGTIGKRDKAITAKVVRRIEMPDNGFGVSWLIVMETEAGHVLKTFTSGAFADVHEGETYTFAATPKEHKEYNGTPETMLSRCALPKAKA